MDTKKETESSSSTEGRVCSICSSAIPSARLKALPTATKCVPCQVAEGDVIKIRRHDDHFGDNEICELYFKKPSHYIERTLQRLNGAAWVQYGANDSYN